MTQTVLHSSRGAVISDVVTPIVMATCTINCFSLTDVCGGKPTKYSEQDWTPYIGKKVIIEGEGFTQWLVAASDPCAGTLEYISISSLGTPLYLNDGSQTDINGNVIGLNGVPYFSFDRIVYAPLRVTYSITLKYDGSCLSPPSQHTTSLVLTWAGADASNNNLWQFQGELWQPWGGSGGYLQLVLGTDGCDMLWKLESGFSVQSFMAGSTPEGTYADVACVPPLNAYYGIKNAVIT